MSSAQFIINPPLVRLANGRLRFTNGLGPDRTYLIWLPRYAPILTDPAFGGRFTPPLARAPGEPHGYKVVFSNNMNNYLLVEARLTIAGREPGVLGTDTHGNPVFHRGEALKWTLEMNRWNDAVQLAIAAPPAERPLLEAMLREANTLLRPFAAQNSQLAAAIQPLAIFQS